MSKKKGYDCYKERKNRLQREFWESLIKSGKERMADLKCRKTDVKERVAGLDGSGPKPKPKYSATSCSAVTAQKSDGECVCPPEKTSVCPPEKKSVCPPEKKVVCPPEGKRK